MSTDVRAAAAKDSQHRVGVLAEIVPLLVESGLEPGHLIRSAGIDPALLRNPESIVPFSAACRLFVLAAEATGFAHIGALVGARGGTQSLGLVGRLMKTAPTLGEAILDLCTNQHRYIRGAVTYLIVQRDTAFWGYAIHQPVLEGASFMCEGAMGIGCAMVREIAGLQPEKVLLARRTPTNGGPFRRALGGPVRFDAEQYAVVLRREWLSKPQRSSDPKLRQILQEQVRAYWAREQPDFSERVSRILMGRLLSRTASAEAVARDLHVTLRTMNRRLEEEGTTFRDLVRQAKYDASRQLMASTSLSLIDIALALGYATPSAFTRAFNAWSGVAPSAWRAAQEQQALA